MDLHTMFGYTDTKYYDRLITKRDRSLFHKKPILIPNSLQKKGITLWIWLKYNPAFRLPLNFAITDMHTDTNIILREHIMFMN